VSHIVTRFAHYMAEYESTIVPVQVFDSTSKQVFSKPVPLTSTGSRLEQDFGPGTYLIRVTLPSGEILANTIEIQDDGKDAQAVLKPKRQSPREELSWAYYLQKAPSAFERAQEQIFTVASDFPHPFLPELTVTFWAHDASGWKVTSEKDRDIFSTVQYESSPDLEKEGALLRIGIGFNDSGDRQKFPAQVWLQASNWAGSQFIALPTVPLLHVLVATNSDSQSTMPFSIQTSNGSPAVDALLSFLSSGDFESARAIGSGWAQRAEEMLLNKVQDPMAATVGGYFLLKAGEIERLHEWTANLANWFKWLPDGPIIRACHLMTRPQPVADTIRNLLLEAVKRGLPYYTIGLRLLQDGLKLFLQRSPEDREIIGALETINPYLDVADPASRATSFTGEAPDQPGRRGQQTKAFETPSKNLEYGEAGS
jgi:hypothetical protein